MDAEAHEPEGDELAVLLASGSDEDVDGFLRILHPADLADLLSAVPSAHRLRAFRLLGPERAGDVLPELEPAVVEDLLAGLADRELAPILGTIESDDAADLLAELEEPRRQRILSMEAPHTEEILQLLRYDEETAGGLMQTELVTVHEGATVGEAIGEIRRQARGVEEFHRVFVVDELGRYRGAVSLDALVLAELDTPIGDLIDDRSPSVVSNLDQEEVARIFEKYDPVSVAVVDDGGRLVGRIVVDDIVDVIEEEANEDILLMAGMSDTEPLETERLIPAARARLSWLLVTFFGGLVNAWFMQRYGLTIERTAALVFFLPLLIALGGGVGSQTATITTRAIALGRGGHTPLSTALARETVIGIVLGTTLGALLGVIAWTWYGDPALGFVLASSMSLCLTVAAGMGVITPLAFDRFGIDPALAAGPIVTISNDIVGVLIYLTIATVVLGASPIL